MEKRRLPRLTLSSEQFRHQDGKLYGVADLSVRGMGLRILDGNDLHQFSVGARVEGTLSLRREKYPVRGVVRHVGRDLVGVEFDGLESRVVEILERLLDPAVIGRDLKPVPTEDLHLWYAGTSGSEFLLQREFDGRISKVTVLALGSWVQWDEEQGVTTGTAEHSYERSLVEGITRFDTLLISPDSQVDRAKVQIAKTLLMSSSLPHELKSSCVRHFTQLEN